MAVFRTIIPDEVEAALAALPRARGLRIREHLNELAELAALAPLASSAPRLIFTLEAVEVSYALRPERGELHVISLRARDGR